MPLPVRRKIYIKKNYILVKIPEGEVILSDVEVKSSTYLVFYLKQQCLYKNWLKEKRVEQFKHVKSRQNLKFYAQHPESFYLKSQIIILKGDL